MIRYPLFIILWLFIIIATYAADNCEQRNALASKADYQQAIPLYQQNIQNCHGEDLATALNNVGNIYLSQGRYENAETVLKQALAERKKLYGDTHEYVAYSLNELAQVYNAQELFSQAEPLLIQALDIKQNIFGQESLESATSLNNLGLLYNNQAEYAKAEPLLVQALDIRQKHLPENHPNIATSQNNLALLYTYLGSYEQAEPLYKQVLTVRKQHYGENHYRVANTLNAMALMYQYQRKLDQAEVLYAQALAIWEQHYGAKHPIVATTLNNLAALYRQRGLDDKAAMFQEHALAIREQSLGAKHPRVANSLNNLAVLYERSKNYAQAETMYLRALQIAMYNQQRELLWLVQNNLSDLLARQGYISAAIFWRKQAVNTLQSLRMSISNMNETLRQSFIENKSDVYAELADLLMKQGRLIEAQQVLTMFKEEQYFDFVERDSSASDIRTTQALYNPAEKKWRQKYTEMSHTFFDIRQQLEKLEQKTQRTAAEQKKYQNLKSQFEQSEIEFQQYLTELRTESHQVDVHNVGQENLEKLQQLQTILQNLGQGAVLLHYLMTDEKLRIILTTSDKQIAREANISKVDLNRKILAFHEKLQDPLKTPLLEAHDLYQYIIKPIEQDLEQADAKTLMLSLDANLNYVAIAALYDGKQYLVEKYALVSYNEASRTKLQSKPMQHWKIVGLGLSDAVLDFNPLPTVITELDNIIQEDKDGDQGIIKGQLFLNQAFSEQTFQSVLTEEYSLMHIASHFVFTPGTQKDSYLLLGNGGKLTLDQVRQKYRFDNLDLLTLSACDTAVGDLANGREIEGFGALAQNQGAKGVIATLWPVNDESTGQFMQHFYQLYVQENTNKAQAMQQVQQAFIQAGLFNQESPSDYPYYYAKPYYWAPFILMGNWL
ncbi:tetratricopeptide repeat protein [Candidatus Albibeggiatoa sp. nov. NOAA]|uniref:CHAT domain-containing protein n=1 Tax=Candidatus Albibeggiatoa sp. nov. NOAA TaxID=3162724 RepID=UPI0032F7E305|nr:tetratricopeptide repeat protein [Thiotrichaceae bacterium]